jgi:hypothetical protein
MAAMAGVRPKGVTVVSTVGEGGVAGPGAAGAGALVLDRDWAGETGMVSATDGVVGRGVPDGALATTGATGSLAFDGKEGPGGGAAGGMELAPAASRGVGRPLDDSGGSVAVDGGLGAAATSTAAWLAGASASARAAANAAQFGYRVVGSAAH